MHILNKKTIKKLVLASNIMMESLYFSSYGVHPIHNEEELKKELPERLFIQNTVNIRFDSPGFFSRHVKIRLGGGITKNIRLQKFLNKFQFEDEYNENNFVQFQHSEEEARNKRYQRSYFDDLFGDGNEQEEGMKIDRETQSFHGTHFRRNLIRVNPDTCEELFSLAHKGNILAIYNIGLIYAHLQRNNAVTYFKISAAAGHINSSIALTEIFRGGLLNEQKKPFLARKMALTMSLSDSSYSLYSSSIHRKLEIKYGAYNNTYEALIRRACSEGINQGDREIQAETEARRLIRERQRGELVIEALTYGVTAIPRLLNL